MVNQQFPTFLSSLKRNNNVPLNFGTYSPKNRTSYPTITETPATSLWEAQTSQQLEIFFKCQYERGIWKHFFSSSLSLDNFIPIHCRRRRYCCTLAHSLTHPHSVGLPWTSDQPVAKTSTWQHTTLTRERERERARAREIHTPDGIRNSNLSTWVIANVNLARAVIGIGRRRLWRERYSLFVRNRKGYLCF